MFPVATDPEIPPGSLGDILRPQILRNPIRLLWHTVMAPYEGIGRLLEKALPKKFPCVFFWLGWVLIVLVPRGDESRDSTR